jgi:hypothetical protein
MAKQEVIKNVFDGGGALDVYDKKYIKYFADYTDKVSLNVFNALRTKDIEVIEDCLRDLSNSASNYLLYIGLVCVVIERERLYEGTEYGTSYLNYANHVLEDLEIPTATLSEAKIIVENFIQYSKPLAKAGFKLTGNAKKLRYLPEALGNHAENEVYNRIANDTFKGFVAWAQRKNIARIVHKPEPDIRVDVEIKSNKLFVDGKNILMFPKGTSREVKEMVKSDLEKTMSIREGGNLPYIIDTYSRGEQTAISNFIKQYRSSK